MNEENKTVQIPPKKAFAVSKVKLAKNGGLDVHYEVTEVLGNESYTNKYHVESAKDVHPDLNKLFKNLRHIQAQILNITSFKSFASDADFKATAKQKTLIEAHKMELLQNIEMRGVSFSGNDENVGVILTSVLEVSNGLKTCVNSPRIKLEGTSFGFEEELSDICRELENEVYAFLFEGKKAQLELFGADGEPAN